MHRGIDAHKSLAERKMFLNRFLVVDRMRSRTRARLIMRITKSMSRQVSEIRMKQGVAGKDSVGQNAP